MSNNDEFDGIDFDMPKNRSNVIKVIGVGGGGGNAVNHMFRTKIEGVDFFICNTDVQALDNSPIPNKIQLGVDLTGGLGVGANPEIGEKAALENTEEIKSMLGGLTKMIFITAGMGGGTGTGAAPIIAKYARELDILTVGIVTIPFEFEGKKRCQQAQQGIKKLRSNVDSLIVINNNKLREIYGNLEYNEGFSKVDEVLTIAARGITEVITRHYKQNIDLCDAKTVLSNSGTAIMGSARASGSDRANKAIEEALDSPLLNDNKIIGAKSVLLLIVSGSQKITIDEIGEINDYIQTEAGNNANIIMGLGDDDDGLEDGIAVTIIATGFDRNQQDEIVNLEPKKIIHILEDEQKAEFDLSPKTTVNQLEEEVEEITDTDLTPTTNYINNSYAFCDEVIVDNQYILSFDTPPTTNTEANNEEKENTVIFDLNEVNDIDVNEQVKATPISECDKDGETQYGIDEYMEVENKLTGAELKEEKDEPKIKEDKLTLNQKTINFNIENVESEHRATRGGDKVEPTDMSEKLSRENIYNSKKIKEFNYKYYNAKSIDDMENKPAYKRQGIILEESTENDGISRTTLSEDSNNNIQLRSNNSFLHDNVD